MPSKLRTSSLTTARTNPGTSVSIAVSRIAGIKVPCVTVVEGLVIGVACAGAPPTPPIRLANSSADVRAVASRYANAKDFVFVQDEPENMGGWTFARPLLFNIFGRDFRYVGRVASASPATGSSAAHKIERQRILDAAFATT